MKKTILIVDDNTENRYLLESLLGTQGYRILSTVNGEQALLLVRKEHPDLILSDILMPIMDGYELCRQIKGDDQLKDIPFLFYTATYIDQRDEDFAIGLGAQAFLLKPMEAEMLLAAIAEHLKAPHAGHSLQGPLRGENFDQLHSQVLFRKLSKKILDLEEMNTKLLREIENRTQAEEKIRLLGSAIDRSPLGVAIANSEGKVLYCNPIYASLEADKTWGLQDLLTTGDCYRKERKRTDSTGIELQENILVYPIRSPEGELEHSIVMVENITQQRNFEDRIFRAQKMEEMVLMTSGITHDFNNFLGAILGFTDLALIRSQSGESCIKDLEEIKKVTLRLSKLTQGLLTFSRNTNSDQTWLELNQVITDFQTLLTQMLPVEISLFLQLTPQDLYLWADRDQIEQIIMNLVINARDAIDSKGLITLTSYSQALNEVEWSVIEVSDTGSGMNEDTIRQITKPFFTTKKAGLGTGLGLSLISSYLELHGGKMEIFSKLGEGSRFRIFLPKGNRNDSPIPKQNTPD